MPRSYKRMWFAPALYVVLSGAVVVTVPLVLGVVGYMLHVNDFPRRRRSFESNLKLHGKTALITGSNTGIGYETARDFARRGARVIMACRNVEKAETAKSQIVDETGNQNIVVMACDISDLESVQKFCKSVLTQESALHILVNNAGCYISKGTTFTKQNYETTVGTNYVGHFLLTHLLLDRIKESAPSRIINVSSCRNFSCSSLGLKVVDDKGFKLPEMTGYPASKLLNIIHARFLASKLKNDGVLVFAVHPGYILDGIFLNQTFHENRLLYYGMKSLKPFSLTSQQGAQTTLYCALEPSLSSAQSGAYFDNCRIKEPNRLALDDALCEQIWNLTIESVKDYTKLGLE